MRKTRTTITTVACLIGLFLTTSSTVLAQDQLGVSVSPATDFIEIPTGSTGYHRITLQNLSAQSVTIVPRLVDFTSDGYSGTPVLKSDHSFPYLTEQSQEKFNTAFTLFAEQEYNFDLQFDVPFDAQSQEYPLTVLFQTSSNNPSETANAEITSVVASNVVAMVKAPDYESTGLTGATIHSLKISESLVPIWFSLDLHNDSGSAEFASGSAKIRNWNNYVVAEYPIFPDVVLGQSDRTARFIENDKPGSSTQYYSELFMLGPYTIQVELLQPNGEYLVVAQHTVFSLPLILIIAGLVGTAVWMWVTHHNFLGHRNEFTDNLLIKRSQRRTLKRQKSQ